MKGCGVSETKHNMSETETNIHVAQPYQELKT